MEANPVRYGLVRAVHHSRVGAIAVCGCEIRSPFREIVAFADVMDQQNATVSSTPDTFTRVLRVKIKSCIRFDTQSREYTVHIWYNNRSIHEFEEHALGTSPSPAKCTTCSACLHCFMQLEFLQA